MGFYQALPFMFGSTLVPPAAPCLAAREPTWRIRRSVAL